MVFLIEMLYYVYMLKNPLKFFAVKNETNTN